MIAKSFVYAAACAAALVSANAASAGVLVDALPAVGSGTYAGALINNATWNYMVQFTLTEATEVTGFSLVTWSQFAAAGDSVVFKLRNDVAGMPAATNLVSLSGTLTSTTPFAWTQSAWSPEMVVATMTFDPIELAAGSYWAGMLGAATDGNGIGFAHFNIGNPQGPADQYQLYGDQALGKAGSIYDLAYQVQGNVLTAPGAVPEPATWAMMIGGFGLVGASMRRRAAKISFA